MASKVKKTIVTKKTVVSRPVSTGQMGHTFFEVHSDSRFFFGILLLLAGTVVLAVNLGAMAPEYLGYWPLLLVAWGLLLIL